MAEFGNIIKIELENAEEQFIDLFVGLANEKKLDLEGVWVEDLYDAYQENNLQDEYFLKYKVNGKNEEWIYLRKFHQEYDFNSNKLYGFYKVIEDIGSTTIYAFEFGDYATEISKCF